MQNISLPTTIKVIPSASPNRATISIQPCYPGYGTTIGNSLRRVLLSSLPGAAVTGFKIKGVTHEFTGIQNVMEDIVEISLNLKQLRVKMHSDEPVRLHLKAKGEKQVTAADIEKNSDAEVISKDLVIATLTDKNAELDMEIIISKGRGYIPTETREKENTEADLILVDSIFTPVTNVAINIDSVRVGQMTNYENVLLDIETDGTISPADALKQANQILIEHFLFISETNISSGDKEEVAEEVSDEESTEEEVEEKPKKASKKKTDK